MPLPAAMFANKGALEFGVLLGPYLTGEFLLGKIFRFILLLLDLINYVSLLLSALVSDII